MTENNNTLSNIAGTINHAFEAVIEDGVFKITPAEAGVAMFAALATIEADASRVEAAADALALQMEKLRDENARYRAHLEHVQLVLEAVGYDDKAAEIDHVLWPVIGVLEDGTEIEFTYDELAEMDIERSYCAQGLTCDCGGAQ